MTLSPVENAVLMQKIDKLRRTGKPCKQWRDTGYFDVPGAELRALVDKGVLESRKHNGHSPTMWRPA